MPRGQIEAVEISNGFQGGLNTEAGPLAFPANASVDEVNFTLEKDGSRRRRKGVQHVTGNVAGSSSEPLTLTAGNNPYSTKAILRSYHWGNAAYSGINIWVIQHGSLLIFRNNSLADPMGAGSTINQLTIPGAPDEGLEISYATILGKLVIAYGASTVAILTYDPIADLVSLEQVSLRTRDVWGVYDGMGNADRLTTLSAAHLYNLRNQGWPVSATSFTNDRGSNVGGFDTVAYFKAVVGAYPAHSDIYPAFTGVSAEDPAAVGTFNPWIGQSQFFGSTEPGRGKYILDLFNRGSGRQSQTGIAGLGQDITYGGISVVGSYAGRVFYAFNVTGTSDTNPNSPNLANMIFFTKVVRHNDDLSACYSQNDPTAPEINDPLATDGGFISIPDIGKVLSMAAIGQSLFILADNGVWEVNGADGGFSATNLNLSKTTTIGCVGSSSVVPAEGMIFYWGRSGIFSIALDPVSLRGAVTNITETTIKTRYLEIPSSSKLYVTGVFLPEERQVRWLYNLGDTQGPYLFDKEIVFDMGFNAFTFNKFAESASNLVGGVPYLFGYLFPSLVSINITTTDVLVGSDTVLVVADTVVVPYSEILTSSTLPVRYATVFPQVPDNSSVHYTVSACVNEEFRDWYNEYFEVATGVRGLDAEGFLLTGAFTGGDTQKRKQVPYLTTHFELTDRYSVVDPCAGPGVCEIPMPISYIVTNPSSCIVHGRWEWTNSRDTGRWTNRFQAYRLKRLTAVPANASFDFEYDLVTTRTKLRGSGRSLSLYFATEPYKDCHLYGWVLNFNVNKDV